MTATEGFDPTHPDNRDRIKRAVESYEALSQQAEADVERLAAENAELRKLLDRVREFVIHAGAQKLSDGTYLDKDCSATMLLTAIAAMKEQKR